MSEIETKSWAALTEQYDPDVEEDKSFLKETEENVEELAYGLEKSRWMLPNVVRTIAAGGDDELLKQREAERLAEIEGRYNLSKERKESGFAISGDVIGTLLDPTALALGGIGIAAKTGQAITASNRAVNALIGAGVSTADYAIYEKSAGEEADPIALALSGVAGGVFGSLYSKTKKAVPTAESSVDDAAVTGSKVNKIEDLSPEPIAPPPNKKDDDYIDKLTASFNAENPSRIQALQDTQTNGQRLGEARKIQRLYRVETSRRASKKKKNLFTDEKYKELTQLNSDAYKYLEGSSAMLARQAEVVGEGISGVAGRLKEEGTFNANMIRRAIYRPMIGSIGGVGIGYASNWASDEDLTSDEIMYYALAGFIGGAASKALMKSNKLSDQDIDMATGEIDKILKSNSLGLLDYITAGSSAAKANAFGGKVATVGKTLFAQRGANLRGAASTSIEENKDLALQELNFSWSKVLSESNATKKGGLVNLFSADAKGLREAAYEYSEGFVDTAKLSQRGFSDTEVLTIINLSKEATSRVGMLTEEVVSTGIKIKKQIEGYKLPQFHDALKIIKNEGAARTAYKKAYRIQSKAETSEEVLNADRYIDSWIDDMISGGSNTQHTSAWVAGKKNEGTILRPLTDHFEKPRMFEDFDARLEIQDFLVKDIDQVYRQYVDNTVPIMEFARKLGAKGEALGAIKKEIRQEFNVALGRANYKQRKGLRKARDGQIKALDDMVNDYFGFVGADSPLAKSSTAQDIGSFIVTGANVARLGKVTITSLGDLIQPLQNSGVIASLKGIARQKDFAKETGFAQRDVLGDELRQYALEVKSPGSLIQRSARRTNEIFFKGIGLTKLTSYARKFAYNSGIERGFVVANKLSKGRSGTGLRNEANSLGISDEYAKTLSKFKSVEEAFEDADGNRILNIIGVKSADRDALIPQIGNRRAFSKSKDPLVRGLGQFLSWAQAKTTQMNSLITRMEDGHDILFVRSLGAIAVVNGIETFKSWLSDPTGADLEIDQASYRHQYATLENFGKAASRTGNFNNYLIDKFANLAASGGRFELDDISPSLDWMTDTIRATIGVADDIAYGDMEGAAVEVSKVFPMGKEIKAGVEALTGERYVDEPNRQVAPLVRSPYKKGGEVLDVPNAPSEPDQRIDKMTGMPYDQQAGAAFTDQEDRQDPLQRMGFGSGGSVQQDPLQRMGFGVGSLVKMGVKALKSLDDEVVEELPMKNTDELIEEGKQMAKALEDGGDEADLLKAGKGDPDNVITYHGTDKVFEEFNDDFISSGTGAQINGYGHYFGLETKARQFRDNVTARNLLKMVDIEERKVDNFKEVVAKVNNSDDFTEEFKNLVNQFDKANLLGEPTLYDAIEKVNSLIKSTDTPVSREVTALADTLPIGKMYKVEILGNKNQFLDWKTPLEKQSKYVQNSIRKTVSKVAKDKDEIDFLLAKYRTLRGRDIYKDLSKLLGGEKKASRTLYSNGIKGNKKETTNGRQQDFIVFSPVLINITKKYSLPTAAITTALLEVGASTQRNEDDKVNKDYKKFYKGGKVLNSLRSKLNNV
jgi:hypothetical protein